VQVTTDVPLPDVQHRTSLQALPESARTARRAVALALGEAGRSDLVESAELLVSELVTNAVMHARTVVELLVVAGPGGVRVSVHDDSPHLPTRRRYAEGATTGRGLELVELMADRHGVEPDPGGGKTVWFELDDGLPDRVPAGRSGAATRTGPTDIEVTLVGVPVVLAMAWRQHVDALLREHLLAQWEESGSGAGGATDGAAHDAFAMLADALGSLPLTRGATARKDVPLRLGAASAPAFTELSELLDRILALAEDGQMLAPATQPEVRLLRLWICGEVVAQLQGAAPTPWPGMPAELEPARVPGPVWDASPVSRAVAAVVAADDVNRIMAASPAALALLGWDESLIGRRIGAIIPERLREAHVAGFTLHLLTGASAIVDREVAVPALRRDGTEVPVLLLVHRESTADGRAVFIATLREASAADAQHLAR
jgi:PAS domain S-box-containing protein